MATVHGSTRREFLAAGASGVAGAALFAACRQPRDTGEGSPEAGPLITRTLGRTGLKLPVVSMGSAYEAGLVRAALDAGIVYVHTSGSYAEQNHERMLSRVFRGRPRESFVVGSSPDFPDTASGAGPVRGPRDAASEARLPLPRRQPAAAPTRAPRHLLPGVDQRARDRCCTSPT